MGNPLAYSTKDMVKDEIKDIRIGVENMDKEKLINMYRMMIRMRKFDETCIELRMQDLIFDGFHPYWGEEAVAAGVCEVLKENDYICSTHRPQGHALAKGTDVKKLLAEFTGRVTGVAKGKGGTMNFVDWQNRFLCTSIVGSGIPLSTGIGLSIKKRKTKEVVICFFGDGSTNTGASHEGINLASVWRLPVVFVCENNLYGEATPVSKVTRIKNLSERAKAYGIEGKTIDGNDVLSVYESALEFVEKARNDEGPGFLEAVTYRIKGHYMGDPESTYRTKEEVEEWKKKCPIVRFRKYLVENKIFSEEELNKVEQEEEEIIEKAKEWALKQEFPSFEVLTGDVMGVVR